MPVAVWGKAAFEKGLTDLGIESTPGDGQFVLFPYTVKDGRFKDRNITIALEIPPDFNVTCPSGPHIKPQLIPINPAPMNNTRAAASSLGTEWEYLSRPFGEGQKGWPGSPRDVKAYMRHINRILETL